jgi:outer membrane immunogenic protein
MKRLIRILAAVLGFAGAGPAIAADMPTKAAPAPYMSVCTVTNCTGFYAGGHVEGEGSNADILGSGINGSIFANGAGLGLHAGYQLWNGNFFAAGEVGGTYDVGSRTVIGDIANVSPWSFEYLAKFGIGLQNLFNSGPPTPSQGPVSVIQNLNAALVSPYAIVGGRTRNFGTGLVTGAGMEYTLGGGWNAYAEYLHVNYNQTDTSGVVPVTIGTENVVRAGINRKF